MKRGSKAQGNSDMLPEYEFGTTVRGKYAERYKERGNVIVLDVDTPEKIQVWAPLVGFRWGGLERQIDEDTWIRAGDAYHAYEEFTYGLAEEERERCRATDHWLFVARAHQDALSAREKINAFLLALWIVRPTRTHVPFRFEEAESGTKTIARVLDRVQWIKSQARDEIQDHHLEQVTTILLPLKGVYADQRRLRNALALTFRACVSSDWQSAFICFAAAAEAMLTYSREPGLTDRLARCYARLTAASESRIKFAQEQFKRFYAVRSTIVHGRAYGRRHSGRNLSDLATFSNLLRRLWLVVLKSTEIRTALEGDDRKREKFFMSP